jgi:hypothetical protein
VVFALFLPLESISATFLARMKNRFHGIRKSRSLFEFQLSFVLKTKAGLRAVVANYYVPFGAC